MMTHMALMMISLSTAAPIADRSVDFDTQVIPLLTKAGCNAGSCHGAAAGRGGFRLSLWGSNPELDYERIVQELKGRRVNLSHPVESLLIAKPTEALLHEGGTRFDYNSPQAKLLEDWIAAGARRDKQRTLETFEVSPLRVSVNHPGSTIQLQVQARFSDGSAEEVAATTVFQSVDDASLTVDAAGLITVHRPGQHTVLVRYLNRIVPVMVRLPLSETEVDLTSRPRSNFIDDHIDATLSALRIPVSEHASPEMLERRLWLDLTGRLPPPEPGLIVAGAGREAVDRARSPDSIVVDAAHAPSIPPAMLDSLLESEAFTDYWTWQFARLFRIRSSSMQSEGVSAFHGWVREQVATNRPLDDMVREMLLANGDSFVIGPANFSRATGSPRDQAEFVAESLLGSGLRCANCHDHPFDRWTQDDYHGLAAVFARVDRGRMVGLLERGEVTHPRTGEAAQPRLPGDSFLNRSPQENREAVADWIVSPGNPLFARAMVNRIWKLLMGRGLVEPVADLRLTNPATHPELLDALAQEFISHDFNLRHMIRLIVSSQTYCRSSVPIEGNATDDRFYSHALRKPMPAEVLVDAIGDVTGIRQVYLEQPLGTRAVTIQDGAYPSPTLDLLGRCPRTDSCSQQPAEPGLPVILHFINGPLLNDKIGDHSGQLQQLLNSGQDDAAVLSIFYRLAFHRQPTKSEVTYWSDQLQAAGPEGRQAVWEDILWAILNGTEFRTIR